MPSQFIKPSEAIDRLDKIHYPGNKRGNPRRLRAALIGALSSGQVEWRCERWQELFTSDSGATFGSVHPSSEEPKHGWPSDFWQPAFVADSVCWQGNIFATYGSVSLRTAPRDVRRWLETNDEAHADWNRCADDVSLNWDDVSELLSGPGWQAWTPKSGGPSSDSPLAAHYRNALIRMIARVHTKPLVLASRKSIYEALFEEFEFGGRTPDESEMRALVRQIWLALQPIEDTIAPD